MAVKEKLRVRASVWIETEAGESLFGRGRLQILSAIRDTGSIKAAAAAMGMSYRGLWGRLKSTEQRLGFALVDSRPGSGPASGSRLTPEAEALMEQYEKMMGAVEERASRSFDAKLRPLLEDEDAS